MEDDDEELLAVVQASKFQSSVKVTVPKRVVRELNLEHGTFVGFYRHKGCIFIKRMK